MTINRITFALWSFYILLMCCLVTLTVHPRTCTVPVAFAASQWLQGLPLYSHTGRGFIYFPQAALAFIPFNLMPHWLGESLWRVVSLGLLAWSLHRFSRLMEFSRPTVFLILSIVLFPLAFDSARNGQFNIILTALMLFTVVALSQEKWWQAAFFVTLGFALKPTMIVLLLLVFALYPKAAWRSGVFLLGLLLMPFLTQNFDYVISQYSACLQMFGEALHVGEKNKEWADLFGLIGQTLQLQLNPTLQYILRSGCALLTLGILFNFKKNSSSARFATLLYSLAAIYLLLFNPRTENNDYVLLAPVLGWMMVSAYQTQKLLKLTWLTGIIICISAGYYLSALIIAGEHCWLAPLMALLVGISVIDQACSKNYYKRSDLSQI